MKKTSCVALLLCLAMVVVATGCRDIRDTYRPGSFGRTPEEEAMVSALMDRYGDLREHGEPRILEAMMASNLVNAIPIDRVTAYSSEAEKLFAWFVYDNFNKDLLTVEWIYLDTDYTIHTFEAQTGENYGRGTFILERPEDGWPTGDYRVIISGAGVQEVVDFNIVDGATVSTPIEIKDGQLALPTRPGWYLTGWEYIISQSDYSIAGRITTRMTGVSGDGGILHDHHVSEGGKNDFSYEIRRTDYQGKVLHSGSYAATWNDPPEYIAPDRKVSFWMSREVEGWGIGYMMVTFQGFGVYGIRFESEDGARSWNTTFDGILTSQLAIPEGREGQERVLNIALGNNYFFRYTYEWRE